MPELRPFRALRYARPQDTDLSRLLCPPFDVISPPEFGRLAALDPANAVHVELPVTPGEKPTDSDYEAAAATLERWIANGTLERDAVPSIYPYEQRFLAADGTTASARGVFAVLRLEPFGTQSGVRPHEATMSAPKDDRLRLLSAVRTNLSPILLLNEDHQARDLFAEMTTADPIAHATTTDGSRHFLWAADAGADVAAYFLRTAGSGSLTIADGHHRYETALRYSGQPDSPPAARYVMVLLFDAGTGGMKLRPWHRLLQGIDADAVASRAGDYFKVESCASGEQVLAALAAGSEPGLFGLVAPGAAWLLTVDQDRVLPLLDASVSETLRWLDVSVLSATLQPMIGIPADALSADGRLTYSSDGSACLSAVESGAAAACFLLRPTPIESVLAVAAAGEFMPAKSTYFEPKAATGLVFNPLT